METCKAQESVKQPLTALQIGKKKEKRKRMKKEEEEERKNPRIYIV